MISNPWLSMDLRVKDPILDLKLVNENTPGIKGSAEGIGLTNTKKRFIDINF